MNTQELQKLANKLRLEAVRMVYEGKDGHPGPALSMPHGKAGSQMD